MSFSAWTIGTTVSQISTGITFVCVGWRGSDGALMVSDYPKTFVAAADLSAAAAVPSFALGSKVQSLPTGQVGTVVGWKITATGLEVVRVQTNGTAGAPIDGWVPANNLVGSS